MIEQSFLLKLSSTGLTNEKKSRLRQEYQVYQQLFQAQPALVQQYLGAQAASLAESVVQRVTKIHFTLPEMVSCGLISEGGVEDEILPAESRKQIVRVGLARFTHPDLRAALTQRLTDLERSSNRTISISAGLLRYATVIHMIYNMLPAGKSVVYESVEGDDIPNQPAEQDFGPDSAIKSGLERQSVMNRPESGRGELVVPYVEAARHFYLPQWVAFDNHGELLLSSVKEAEADIASMQNYLAILHSAIAIAPYMSADEICQQKRYGMLGQLVNQGRALAHYQSQEIIQTIKRRVAEHKMDRGLRISLPYFDDQKLVMDGYNFEVIPAGRIMFVPAFVVLAVQRQGAKVAQETHFSRSTRKHLLTELSKLEQAFLR